jgi:hypothetical protein
MIIGMAPWRVRTPPATQPTVIDVVVEELWIMLVASIPINSPTIGLEVVSMRVSANPFPIILKEAPIN